jgi:glycosyltransferase involved in cell wall biosynthesis
MYKDNRISLIMPIYKKELTIKPVLDALKKTTSIIDEYVFVIDGNVDKTEEIVRKWCNDQAVKFQLILEHDVNEVLCCIAGAKAANGDIFIFVQDDMCFYECGWDRLLCEKVMTYGLVGGRLGCEFTLERGIAGSEKLRWRLKCGRDTLIGRIALAIHRYMKLDIRFLCSGQRTYVNRGPFVINAKIYNSLGGFDPIFAPIDLDCMDLSCKYTSRYDRPYVYPVGYNELAGTKVNSEESQAKSRNSVNKNSQIIVARHRNLSC